MEPGSGDDVRDAQAGTAGKGQSLQVRLDHIPVNGPREREGYGRLSLSHFYAFRCTYPGGPAHLRWPGMRSHTTPAYVKSSSSRGMTAATSSWPEA